MNRHPAPTARRAAPRRPLLALGALLLLGLGALAVWAVRPAEPPAPVVDASAPGRLVAAQPVVDLGRVPFSRRAEARFELVNTGGAPVALTGRPKVTMLEGC
jgi:hypothetical protein